MFSRGARIKGARMRRETMKIFGASMVCLSIVLGSAAGCSGDEDPIPVVVGTDTDEGTGRDTTDTDTDRGTENGGGSTDTDNATDCDCPNGVCIDGACCPESQACDEECCSGDEVCFANACVVPGKLCHSAADCDEGEYCEPALWEGGGDDTGGDGDTGTDGQDQKCFQGAPEAGRCLEVPAECPPGDTDAQDCLPPCEYHPPAGKLKVKTEWSWGLDQVVEYPDKIDVWSTPVVGRVYDSNCDGTVDELDPPVIAFVSGDAGGLYCSHNSFDPSRCQTGVLRALDGASGQEIWSLDKAQKGSTGFAAMTLSLGDVDGDSHLDIVASTGEGHVVLVDRFGEVQRISDKPISHAGDKKFGWGGGFALADMNRDGFPEIGYCDNLFTTMGTTIERKFVGKRGLGGRDGRDCLSTFADIDGKKDGFLELVAGPTVYDYEGNIVWDRTVEGGVPGEPALPDGYPGIADLDGDGRPDVVLVGKGQVWVLEGATGATKAGPYSLSASGFGGPPTIADFDGDGDVEIGVAQKDLYYALQTDFGRKSPENRLFELWTAYNHDISSSVTGSTVFDFQGDGKAEVVYGDECYQWVYDGTTGEVVFATPNTSFTATEASMLADVDGDGHAEMVMISNGIDTSPGGSWKCGADALKVPGTEEGGDPGRPAWSPPKGAPAYRGLTVFGDASNAWVGTRSLWNQHTYHVSNICDHRDDACAAPNGYGDIPAEERANWTVPWLNNFRQNVQDGGLFDAPDATVTLSCGSGIELVALVRNLGQAVLPAGVTVGFYVVKGGVETELHTAVTPTALFPGQSAELSFTPDGDSGVTGQQEFRAKILVDAEAPLFRECRADNNTGDATCPRVL